MDVTRVGSDRFLEVGEEGDDVVPGGRLDFVDARGRHAGGRLDPSQGLPGDDAALGIDLTDGELDLEPGFVLGFLAPESRHLRSRITTDRLTSACRLAC